MLGHKISWRKLDCYRVLLHQKFNNQSPCPDCELKQECIKFCLLAYLSSAYFAWATRAMIVCSMSHLLQVMSALPGLGKRVQFSVGHFLWTEMFNVNFLLLVFGNKVLKKLMVHTLKGLILGFYHLHIFLSHLWPTSLGPRAATFSAKLQ